MVVVALKAVRDALAGAYARPVLSRAEHAALLRPWRAVYAEGEVTAVAAPGAVAALTPQRLAAAVAALTGPIQQVPSAVSAIKVDGRRSYARVRAGEDVALPARPVTVSTFDVLGGPSPEIFRR